MATYTNESFSNQDVVVDGNEYIDCRFTNCVLVYRGTAAPDFTRCSFTGGSVQLEGDAVNTTNYLKNLYAAGGSNSVDGVLSRVTKGTLGFANRPAPCDPVNTGNHYGRLAIYAGVMIVLTLFYLFLFSYAGLTAPREKLDETNPAVPLRAEIPLDLMPALPDELAMEYDALRASQLEDISTFGWVDAEAGTVHIPIENAFAILLEQQADAGEEDASTDEETSEEDESSEEEGA